MQLIIKILFSSQPEQYDLAFGKLADFSGIESVFLPVDEYITEITSPKPAENRRDILALSCKTLADVYHSPAIFGEKVSLIKNMASFLLIYGIAPGSDNAGVLKNFTNGVVKDVIRYRNNESEYVASSDNPDITRYFSGLSFGPVKKEADFGLEVSDPRNNIAELVVIGSSPIFLLIEEDNCCIFLLATNQLIDIDRKAEEMPRAADYFSGLVLPLMFIKYVFKDFCWHNEMEYASLTIDDPLIKNKYGFLDYDSLLTEMDRHNFFTNIAFIPWNYQRTDKRMGKIFRERNDRLGVCVHGCDHTGSEFGIKDQREIDRKAKLSLRRMMLHEGKYHIPFDRIMCFPQGVFSAEAMLVLKANNYLAAINSDFEAVEPGLDIKLRDVLEPAVMSYHSFPLYYRRYPGDIASFAFDLFLGKPALIVTHHNDYQKMETITDLVRMLNALSGNINWMSLSNIVQSSYLTRRLREYEFQIRLYSPVANVFNQSDHIATYHIYKREHLDIKISQVKINGSITPYELDHNDLGICTNVPPKSSINVEIIYEELYSDTEPALGKYTNLKIALRRILSEIRDNYIAKQPLLLTLYNRLRKYI